MLKPAHKLILHSSDAQFIVAEPAALIETLQQQGLCAKAFEFAGNRHYRVGTQFLSLINFLGCSPTVDTAPDENNSASGFCHIELVPELAQVSFLGGDNAKPPRCTHCRQRETQWQALLEAWQQAGEQASWHCPQCGRNSGITELDWREYGGFGRCYIAVWGIGEGLAVPSDKLLVLLQQQTQSNWRFFYSTHKQ